jgi:hypothetical protein
MLGHRDGCHRKSLKTFNAGPIPLIFQCEALRERTQAPSVSAVAIGRFLMAAP